MSPRRQVMADVIGSVRAEGLEPGATVVEILERWVAGELETVELGQAAECLAIGEPVDCLRPSAEFATARR